ncbi:MAG: hypothetical protein CL849_05845 [Crocinitomicaceae bacterium]|nr:hypothetical protein [Crocinitomicaceae bacterium]
MRPLLLAPLVVLVACSGAKDVPLAEWNSPFSVQAASIENDTLNVTVQYGGGFREHAFRLVADEAATKSLPRQLPIRIEHESNGDMGRALIAEERAFDLRHLRDPSQGRIVLHLTGWDSPLEYVYLQ